jgi:hypothetical protein
VELGVPAELIEEKLLVTQTGKRLLEWEKWENTSTREEDGREWKRMEQIDFHFWSIKGKQKMRS